MMQRTNIEYASASEYACCKMLEKYLDWRPVAGVTSQIKVGRTTFDFRVNGAFVEFHPISLRREFITDGMHHISSAMQSLPKAKKVDILRAVALELEAQYAKRRGQVLSAHPAYRDARLICVHSPEAFICKVIYAFSVKKCGDLSAMKFEFNKLRKGFIARHRSET